MPQQAVAERPSCLYQRPPGLGSDDAVGRQPPLPLEAADGREGLGPEVPIGPHSFTKCTSEALLYVEHGRPGITGADESDHVRRSLGGAAPTTLPSPRERTSPGVGRGNYAALPPGASDVRR